jgi:hypothetical protein
MTYRLSVCSSLLFLLATACGGGATKEAESPSEPPAEASGQPTSEPSTGAEVAPDAGAEAPAPEPEAPKDEGPAGPSGGRTPKDIVGAEGSRFVLNFNSSEIGVKAGEECDAKHKSDPKKRNECIKYARTRVKEDVMQFELSPTGRWVWTTSTQRGSTLIQLRKTNFDWGAETKNSIELKPSSGDAVVLGVPSNYSVVFDHPTHGKLTYDSKRND